MLKSLVFAACEALALALLLLYIFCALQDMQTSPDDACSGVWPVHGTLISIPLYLRLCVLVHGKGFLRYLTVT